MIDDPELWKIAAVSIYEESKDKTQYKKSLEYFYKCVQIDDYDS